VNLGMSLWKEVETWDERANISLKQSLPGFAVKAIHRPDASHQPALQGNWPQ